MNIGTACCHRPDCADHKCEGRPDPELTRRQQEAELRWQCRDQMDSRQIAAHFAAGELSFPIGYESADPAHREPVRVAREPLPVQFAGREPFDWQLIVIWIAVCVCIAALYALSIADPRDLSTIWPRLVALASF